VILHKSRQAIQIQTGVKGSWCGAELDKAVRFPLTVRKRPNYNRGMSRKVILGFGISIDGYIARPNGAMDYLVIDKEGEAVMADFFAQIDTTIMGRKTAAATAEMRKSGEIPEMPGISNYVFSRRWKPGKRDGFEVVSGSLIAFVRKLKRRKGKDIYLGGGGQLCRSFLQEDLVDELFIGLSPVLLGDGIPGFPGKFPQRLQVDRVQVLLEWIGRATLRADADEDKTVIRPVYPR